MVTYAVVECYNGYIAGRVDYIKQTSTSIPSQFVCAFCGASETYKRGYYTCDLCCTVIHFSCGKFAGMDLRCTCLGCNRGEEW